MTFEANLSRSFICTVEYSWGRRDEALKWGTML